jgi:hypothetical protein
VNRDEHLAAAQHWLTQAEQMFDNEADDGADVTAAAGIATAHAALAAVVPLTLVMQQGTWTPTEQATP